jgi:hypothetical protein
MKTEEHKQGEARWNRSNLLEERKLQIEENGCFGIKSKKSCYVMFQNWMMLKGLMCWP